MTVTSSNETNLLQRIKFLEEELEKYANNKTKRTLDNHIHNHNENENKFEFNTTEKAGYLFKWQDREIGWGGTKWARRFVKLDAHRGQLAYFKSAETANATKARYILNLRGCAVRDDGSKPIKEKKGLHLTSSSDDDGSNANAHWHVFSIYFAAMNSSSGENVESFCDDEVPLLRFSTRNLTEKTQWMVLINQACILSNTEEATAITGPISPYHESIEKSDNVIASPRTTNRLKKIGSADLDTLEELKKLGSPNKGTLPPVIFSKIYSRKKTTVRQGQAKSNPRHRAGYPPSRPMHQKAEASYFSEEAAHQNYRGFFNLAFIILIISNFRLIIDNFVRHGFVLWELLKHADVTTFLEGRIDHFPLLKGEIVLLASVAFTFLIELLLSKKVLSERFGCLMHILNINGSLVILYAIVWYLLPSPLAGILLMMQSTVSWMKLVSYTHANSDYRNSGNNSHQATASLIDDVEESDKMSSYPSNINIKDIFYFWFAPTLTYQIAFPRTERIRWTKVLSLLVRIFIFSVFLVFLVTQTITPYLDKFRDDGDFSQMAILSTLLKLAIPNTYVWLIFFYLYFHLFLNLLAELLRFGDRVFYKDWWNCSEVSSYWRLWNMPVHYWLIRHIYFPFIRFGISNTASMVIVFAISGIFHEVMISIPFHMMGYWSFIGMMGQIPLVFITKTLEKKFPGGSIGNMLFWVSFCIVGQPMAILLYCIDYWKADTIDTPQSLLQNACIGAQCEL